MSTRTINRLAVAAMIAACSMNLSGSAMAADVLIVVEGRVAQNTFGEFPFETTPLGARVVFSCLADSDSGFEFVPGVKFGIRITSMKMSVANGLGGQIVLNSDATRSLAFSTSGITSAIPDNDQMEFDPITLSFGALGFRQTLKLVDADDESWPSVDLTQLNACGIPGTNFENYVGGDRKHWYLEGQSTFGVLNIELVEVRQLATSAGDGDMNADGAADGADLQLFARAVLDLSTDVDDVCHGDFSVNGIVDPADIPGMVNVLLTGIAPPPIPPMGGACCYYDQFFIPACQTMPTLAACEGLAGFSHQFTLGVACEDLDPPCLGGSCCYLDGTCQTFGAPTSTDPQFDCANSNGFFIDGGTCEPNTCFSAPTACCLNDQFGQPTGTCIVIHPDDCVAMNGTPNQQGGVPCDPNPCLVACCVGDGSCSEITELDCLALGGTYNFNQVSCEFFKCPPENDDCANPIQVTEGSIIFDLGGATTDGDELPQFFPGCEQGLATENFIDNDVWFTYEAACTGVVQIDTCGSYDLGDSSNTTIAVYDDCVTCPPSSADSLIVCNNREQAAPVQLCFGNGGAGFDAAIRFDAIAGVCYKIRVGTEDGTPSGVGVLNIVCGGACCPPDGGLCTIETQAYCEQVIGGYYGGDGTDCDFNVCPGACCHTVGEMQVCEIVNGVNTCLIDLQGTYLGDATTCEPGACGGACCIPAIPDCVVTSADDCASQGGNYLGDGIACTYDSFGISTCATGACCDGVTCVNEVRGTCDFDFFPGEDCSFYVCLDARPGVCCDGISCQDTIYGECNGPNTAFYFGLSCDSFTCPDARIGACCLPNQTCVERNVPDCEALAGVYQGEFTTCAGVDCSNP
ncbi:MAG: hypothetical protein H6818_18785 [Phycisphaerales bacterium]|nr:hypothetical protein [Phycisphaerales bacterium]MCB9863794.1 hypothetical protein [Phycisphaerales bacterium]